MLSIRAGLYVRLRTPLVRIASHLWPWSTMTSLAAPALFSG